MSDLTTPTPPGDAPGTHCTWCGAEYTEPVAHASVPSPPARRAPDETGDEPRTHCEWCGAEYPIPEGER